MAVCSTAFALNWTVADGGTQSVFGVGAGDGKNHVFHNKGIDGTIVVKVFNASGSAVSITELGIGSDVTVNIPVGGSAQIEDAADATRDSDGASGTYT